MHITTKPSRLSRLKSSIGQSLRPLLVITSFAVVVFVVPVIADAATQKIPPTSAYQQQLKNQVETSTGAPKTGYNPANQAQTSLEAAGSTTNKGIGQRVDRPAAKLVGTTRKIEASNVLPNSKTTGISVSGCLLDYGTPGEQCVPSRAPNDQPVTCDFIRTMFPKGVAITGTDRLGLSTGNKTACGA